MQLKADCSLDSAGPASAGGQINTMPSNLRVTTEFPDWIPDAVRLYLNHTEDGLSLRALARRDGCHASTVLRQVRRYESLRDDPLMDEALSALSIRPSHLDTPARKGKSDMTAPIRSLTTKIDDATILREGQRVLRRLAEPGSVLVIAPDMERAVVMREFGDGKSARTAVLERAVAQAFVLKDWIVCRKAGRVSTYELTSAGRMTLRRMLEAVEPAGPGLAEAPRAFAGKERDWTASEADSGRKRFRYHLTESPVAVLARRRDKDGKPFLEAELVEAAERLREDFELAQVGPRVTQNWEGFLTAGCQPRGAGDGLAKGPTSARERVTAALRDLGPGLGDVVLRVCCFLEGIEAAEQQMGWAARSGKIVLRIALMRLRRHYEETYGRFGPLIG